MLLGDVLCELPDELFRRGDNETFCAWACIVLTVWPPTVLEETFCMAAAPRELDYLLLLLRGICPKLDDGCPGYYCYYYAYAAPLLF